MKVSTIYLAGALLVSFVSSSLSAQTADTVIGFEDLSQDTIVVAQYSNLGVVFGPNGVLPHAVKVGPGVAQSGSTVVSFSCGPNCNQEFPVPSMVATFIGGTRNRVSMYVGAFAGPGAPAQLTLTARNDFGLLVAQSSVTVTPGAGFHTRLSVQSQQPDIASFELSARPNLDVGAQVGLDELSFDNPAGTGGADFGLRSTSSSYEVIAGGAPTDVPISIFRIGGSNGNIAFDIPSLQPGLQATFLPNPTAGNNVTLRLSAAPATPTIFYTVTIRGTPTSVSVAPYPRYLTLTILVVPGLQIFGSSVVDLSGCKNSGAPEGTFTVPLQVIRNYRVTGPVTLQISGVPSGVTASLSPSTLTFPGGATGQGTTLTLSEVAGILIPDTPIQVQASDGVLGTTFVIFVHGMCPRHNKDFVIQGTFSCESVWGSVKPISHAQVEFFRYRSDWFDDWVGATITNDDGTFRQDLWARIEGDYYARLRLDDKEGVHLNDSWTASFWSIDSPHVSNRNPIIDLGDLVISRNNGWGTPRCAIWQGAHDAYQEFHKTVGSLPPDSDYSIVLWKGFQVPISRLATTDWPDNYPTGEPGWAPSGETFHDEMTNFHEFGHTIRQSVDGDYNHFINDVITYDYGHSHYYCDLYNHGFAFNEGWAEYWSKEPNYVNVCHTSRTQMGVEGVVATDLAIIERCTGVGRQGMFSVLQQGQNIVHSDLDFRNRFRQRFPNLDPSACDNQPFAQKADQPLVQRASLDLGLPSGVSSRSLLERTRAFLLGLLHKEPPITAQRQLEALSADIAAQKGITKELRQRVQSALKIAADPGTCPSTPCDVVAQRVIKPAMLSGEIEMSEQMERQLESELATTQQVVRSNPFLRSDAERRAQALKFDAATKEIVLKAIRAATLALTPLAPQDRSGSLTAQIAELQRQEKLLLMRSTADDVSLTFLKTPRSSRDDVIGNAVLHPYIPFLAKDYRIVWLFSLLVLLALIASIFAWRRFRLQLRKL